MAKSNHNLRPTAIFPHTTSLHKISYRHQNQTNQCITKIDRHSKEMIKIVSRMNSRNIWASMVDLFYRRVEYLKLKREAELITLILLTKEVLVEIVRRIMVAVKVFLQNISVVNMQIDWFSTYLIMPINIDNNIIFPFYNHSIILLSHRCFTNVQQ